jgi:predicted adenylyl cyclase CyaB
VPQNIEIKARVADMDRLRLRVQELTGDRSQLLIQEDVFFTTPSGRLKLRIFDAKHGELIYYQRSDQAGPKESNYLISKTGDPESIRLVLESAYGVRGIVRKKRELYLSGQTRIHLDIVEGLGDFLELEYVMQLAQDKSEGLKTVNNLMSYLGVMQNDLVSDAYIDLLSPTLSPLPVSARPALQD